MMRLLFSTILALGGVATISSCSTAPAQQARSPHAQKELAEALAGRTQGPPVRCLPSYRDTRMEVIDDWTILFRDGRTVYVQNPRGGCRGIGIGRLTLVTRKFGTNQTCEGDINQLVDLQTGIGGGACVFGPFIPYTKPS
jgi:hypothetical protein